MTIPFAVLHSIFSFFPGFLTSAVGYLIDTKQNSFEK